VLATLAENTQPPSVRGRETKQKARRSPASAPPIAATRLRSRLFVRSFAYSSRQPPRGALNARRRGTTLTDRTTGIIGKVFPKPHFFQARADGKSKLHPGPARFASGGGTSNRVRSPASRRLPPLAHGFTDRRYKSNRNHDPGGAFELEESPDEPHLLAALTILPGAGITLSLEDETDRHRIL